MTKHRSKNKVYAEEKKSRDDNKLKRKIEELEKENNRLRREIEAYKAAGKVPVIKEKPAPVVKLSPVDKRKEALEKARKWREENFGKYEEE